MPPRSSRHRRLAALLFAGGVFASASLAGPPVPSADVELGYDIEAAYLYKLTRYVEWPEGVFASPGDPFVIAVVARGAADERIVRQALLGKRTSGGRAISVVLVAPGAALPAHCEIAFVLRSAHLGSAGLRRLVDDRPLLLVGETDGFAERGGEVNFIFVDDNVRLQVNPDRAERVGLRLRSLLASAAQLVHDKPGVLP
ncbi:MAG: YfiR family protein [Opitutaceae bacterium]